MRESERSGSGIPAPVNLEAEQSVLGAMLANAAVYPAVADFLPAAAFAEGLHVKIFEAIGRLIDRGQPVNPISLRSVVDPEAAKAAGNDYFLRLVDVALPAAEAIGMARIVFERYVARQSVDAMRAAIDGISRDGGALDGAAEISAVADRLSALAASAEARTEARPLGTVVEGVLESADAAFNRGGGLSGLSTGLRALDGILGGLHPGDLAILAARPSMGKTALATDIAFNVATSGTPAGFFSVEMSSEQIGGRIVAGRAGVAGHKVRQGTMNRAEMDRLINAGSRCKDVPLFIDDTASMSIATLRGRARRMQRQHGIGLLIVDYLQLLTGGGDRRDGRVQEIGEITRGLKATAKELGVPVLALSQLSRAVEQRPDKRPQLADLRESGSIEQDADVVMFVYRHEYYCERSDRRGTQEHINALGQAEIIIAKQRHGPTGTVQLAFDGALTRFADLGAALHEEAAA